MPVRAKVLGVELIQKRMERFQRTMARSVVPRAMDEIAADLLERSVGLAPILTGDLIRSARIVRAGSRRSRGVIRRTVSFGTDHAVQAHENITPAGPLGLGPVSQRKDAQARTADGPVGGHFLLRPFRAHVDRYQDFLRKAFAEGVRSVRIRSS